jgi:hypothetical protein
MTSEHDRAIREGACIGAADEYFAARPHIRHVGMVGVFEEGFRRGYDAAQPDAIIQGPRSGLTVDGIIKMYHAKRPQLVWHVGTHLLRSVRNLKDETGRYLSQTPCPPTTPRRPLTLDFTLLGHDIVEVQGGYGIQLMMRTATGDVPL